MTLHFAPKMAYDNKLMCYICFKSNIIKQESN